MPVCSPCKAGGKLWGTSPQEREERDPHRHRYCLRGGPGPITAQPFTVVALCFQPDVSLGNCWAYQGSRGQVVIRLPAKIQATMVTVHHTSDVDSALGKFSSAPRDFTVSVSVCWALGAGMHPGEAVTGMSLTCCPVLYLHRE